MNLTGQPLIDVGLAIATILNDKQSVTELSEDELRATLNCILNQTGHPKKNPLQLDKLKVLSSYWQNNPMIGLNMGKDDENLIFYRNILVNAMSHQVKTTRGHCQICGVNEIFIDANRSWFPLGSSSDSDPCTLPNLAGKFLCSRCFSAIVLLPLGCRFVANSPYLYHLSDSSLICEANSSSVNIIQTQIAGRASGNAGITTQTKFSGRLALLEIVSGSYLWDHNFGGILSKRSVNGATIIVFNNSGTKIVWLQLHIPAQALDFFAALDSTGLRETFLKWAIPCKEQLWKDDTSQARVPNNLFEHLCDDVEQRRSLAPLLRAILLRRQSAKRVLSKEEFKVLEIYEDIALGKEKRFQLLERISSRINDMKPIYRDSFVRQLGNISKKEYLLKLLKDFAHKESTMLRLTSEELYILDQERSNEVVSLIYLLCVAENEKE